MRKTKLSSKEDVVACVKRLAFTQYLKDRFVPDYVGLTLETAKKLAKELNTTLEQLHRARIATPVGYLKVKVFIHGYKGKGDIVLCKELGPEVLESKQSACG